MLLAPLRLEHQDTSAGQSHFGFLEKPQNRLFQYSLKSCLISSLSHVCQARLSQAPACHPYSFKRGQRRTDFINLSSPCCCLSVESLSAGLQFWHHSGQHSWSAAGRSRKQIRPEHMNLAALPYTCL